MQQAFFQKLIKSPLALIFSAIVFTVVLYNFWGVASRLYFLYSETSRMEAEIAGIQKQNEMVKKEIANAESAGFLEREGKASLNLKQPGEEVVVIVEEKRAVSSSVEDNKNIWQRIIGAAFLFFSFK